LIKQEILLQSQHFLKQSKKGYFFELRKGYDIKKGIEL